MGNNCCCFKRDPIFVHPSRKQAYSHRSVSESVHKDDYMRELIWNEELNDWTSVR